MSRAFVLGGGGWGTALAMTVADRFERIDLWEHDAAYAAEVEASRENSRYLPGLSLPAQLHMAADLTPLRGAALLVLSVPSDHFRRAWTQAAPLASADQLAVVATKGMEPGSLLTMRQVAEEVSRGLGAPVPRFVTLSGPSHAEEVGRRLPTTVVSASPDADAARQVQVAFNHEWFRVYTSGDPLGVEIAGALKNVVALAAGLLDGLGLGDNAKAALMTRGLAEMTRLGQAMGAQASTFSGLAGMGDLVVTCMSRHSRNRGIGERIGKGETWAEISKTFRQAVEGTVTARSAVELAARHQVELPICREVFAILYEAKDPRQALKDLLNRPLKMEG